MDSLFGGSFPPGKTTARKYASMLLDGFAESRPAAPAMGGYAAPASNGEYGLAPSVSRDRRTRENREFEARGATSDLTAESRTDGARSFSYVNALFGMPSPLAEKAGYPAAAPSAFADGVQAPTPLRLENPGTEAEESAALGLRVLEGVAMPRSVSAEAASYAAGLALERGGREASSSDRVLGAGAALPPEPMRRRNHGWLPYWTAAAASRLLLARAY
ncbi:MAG: hypothetical protein HY925_14205 [Elusimicrobia bacterium]|nr:hypothetical protein [Elusimicrobiota bacterium]